MKRDTLHNLLTTADAVGMRAAEGAEPADRADCADRDDLAGQVRSRARRRKHVRLSLAAVAVTVMGLAGLMRLMPSRENPLARGGDPIGVISDRNAEASRLQAEIFELQREARRSEELVKRFEEAERRGRLAAQMSRSRPSSDALSAIRFEQDRSALILVQQAQRFDTEMRKRPEALDAYRRVVALFPQSQWADVARKRLDEMQG